MLDETPKPKSWRSHVTFSQEELAGLPPETVQKIQALQRQNQNIVKASTKIVRNRRAATQEQDGLIGAYLELENQKNEIEKSLTTDLLTKCGNRLGFEEQSQNYFKIMRHHVSSAAYGQSSELPLITFVAVDLDGFKRMNDELGHQEAGDVALKKVAAIFKRHLRGSDYISRPGGDEFNIILSTDEENAHKIMQRLRAHIEREFSLPGDKTPCISFSYGLCQLKPTHASVEEVIKASDKAQLADKKNRSNIRCNLAEPTYGHLAAPVEIPRDYSAPRRRR